MRKVRRKTVEPLAKTYLLKAKDEGIKLSWNNYEDMLPQDGFSLLGLSCFDCLQGPCRLNPFEQNEVKTVCGLTKDQLVLNSLKRLLLADNSVMQVAMMLVDELPAKLNSGNINAEVLKAKAAKWEIKGETNQELVTGFAIELAKINNSCFANEISNLDDLKQLASYRADLMTLTKDLQEIIAQPTAEAEYKFGLGLLKSEAVNVCLEGVSPLVVAKLQTAVEAMNAEAKNSGATAGFNLTLVGDVLPGNGMGTVTNTGGAELAILTGLVDLYVTGEVLCSRAKNAAAAYHTVQKTIKPTTGLNELKEMLSQAVQAYSQRNQSKVKGSEQLATGKVGFELGELKNQQFKGLCLVGGGSSVKVTSDENMVRLVEGLAENNDVLTLTYGNGAATLGKYGCLNSNNVAAIGGELDAAALVEVVAELNSKKVVAVFPELTCSKDLQMALALAAVGAEVITGIKLPLDGAAGIALQVSGLIRYCEPAELVGTVVELFK